MRVTLAVPRRRGQDLSCEFGEPFPAGPVHCSAPKPCQRRCRRALLLHAWKETAMTSISERLEISASHDGLEIDDQTIDGWELDAARRALRQRRCKC
jgi:hypothetical protein